LKKLYRVAKNINVLNGLLFLALCAIIYYGIVPYLNVTIQPGLPTLEKAENEETNRLVSQPNPSFTDYVVVSDQNLFHPERKIPQEKKVEVETGKIVVIPKPDLVLYGTLITNDLSIAYIEDRKAPFSTPGRGKRPRPMKKGDNINGYVLRDIKANSIVLENGQEQLVVMLDEKDKKREGETAPAIPASPSRSPVPGVSQAATNSPATTTPSPVPVATPQTSPATAPDSVSNGNPPIRMWPPPVRRPPYN
jgi:hypothetical protein